MYQVVLDGKATNHKFESAASCMDMMIRLKKEYPKSVVTFLEIDLT